MKLYFKCYAISVISILISFLLLTFLVYFDIINNSFYNVLKTLFLAISVIIGSFMFGKGCNNRGMANGIRFGIIFVIFIFNINLLFIRKFDFSLLLSYLIIIMSSLSGSVAGINIKKEKDS